MEKCKWIELEVDNLPSDLLVGDYEFRSRNVATHTLDDSFWQDLLLDLRNECRYQYRKKEQKQPSHEEIRLKIIKMVAENKIIEQDIYDKYNDDALF